MTSFSALLADVLARVTALAATMGDALQLRGIKPGGTAGQVPVKTDDTDWNWSWGDVGGGDLENIAGTTNLTYSRDETTLTVVSDTGTAAVLPGASISLAGVMSASDKVKLDGITIEDYLTITSAASTYAAKTTPFVSLLPPVGATELGGFTVALMTYTGSVTPLSFQTTSISSAHALELVEVGELNEDYLGVSITVILETDEAGNVLSTLEGLMTLLNEHTSLYGVVLQAWLNENTSFAEPAPSGVTAAIYPATIPLAVGHLAVEYSEVTGKRTVYQAASIAPITWVRISSLNGTLDADKPVSGPQQAALDLKADGTSPVFDGNINLTVGTLFTYGDGVAAAHRDQLGLGTTDTVEHASITTATVTFGDPGSSDFVIDPNFIIGDSTSGGVNTETGDAYFAGGLVAGSSVSVGETKMTADGFEGAVADVYYYIRPENLTANRTFMLPGSAAISSIIDGKIRLASTLRTDGVPDSIIPANASATRTHLKVPASDPTGIGGASALGNLVTLSLASYTALATKDPATLYVIA